ncbi:unnamed protein product [Cylindrotheca closterium]|uniref:Uncharacterized protein n=1 Tax=Cylindrotheca closterium TaxID=2856 RepID=A0AAD2CUB2_9STRA|nr:unnamed protein product [Cylindrotheca closterium]
MSWLLRFLAVWLLLALPTVVDAQLPACISSSLSGFTSCVKSIADGCLDRCMALKDTVTENPFESLDIPALATCTGFQTQIMDPVCPLAGCCSECIPKLLEFMTCIVQEAYQVTPFPCELTCSARRLREHIIHDGGNALAFSETISRRLLVDEPSDSTLMDDCGYHLDPTGTGAVPSASEMAEIIGKGDMFVCLGTAALTVANKQVGYNDYKKKTTVNMDWGIPEVGLALGTAIGIALFAIGLCGVCCAAFCYRRSDGSRSRSSKKPSKEIDDHDDSE